jgi:SlyX protein
MEMDDIEDRFERLETKLAFLEDFVERLQTEVVARNGITDRLFLEQGALKEKLLQLSQEMEEIPNRRPPHY